MGVAEARGEGRAKGVGRGKDTYFAANDEWGGARRIHLINAFVYIPICPISVATPLAIRY